MFGLRRIVPTPYQVPLRSLETEFPSISPIMVTFAQLHQDRCYFANDKWVPNFWSPQPLQTSPHTLFGDDSEPVLPEWGIRETVSRILALGLSCEIPVGELVLAGLAKELPEEPGLEIALRANIADEARHYKGFDYAIAAYGSDDADRSRADELTSMWQAFPAHPIAAAAALETGIFLCTLGALRLFGGRSLAHLAAAVARDEYRHVAFNRGIVSLLKCDTNFGNPISETIDWLFTPLSIPADRTGVVVDRDFFIKAAFDLIETGQSIELDNLVYYSSHTLPFEVENSELYDREITDR